MTAPAAHVELRRSIGSIAIGRRHRQDLGDLTQLADSIEQYGLWQLPTVTPEGVLICGRRRLSAMEMLGMKTTDVWVRSVSGRLGQLLAERDENVLQKPLTLFESAALFRELTALMSEDAAQRQAATRFGAAKSNGEDGGGKFPPPLFEPGKTREQAARMITGRGSYKTLERAGRLEDLAADSGQPSPVRERAAEEIERIKAGGRLHPSHLRINAELSLAELDRLASDETRPPETREQARTAVEQIRQEQQELKAAELERLAAEALARVKAARQGTRSSVRSHSLPAARSGEPVRYPLRAFVATWDDLAGWWDHYDPTLIGPALSLEQWNRFEAAVAGTVTFANAARDARDGATTAPEPEPPRQD